MPGAHDPTKRFISFSIPRSVFYKMTQYAAEHQMTRNQFASQLFESEMNRLKVELTEENKAKAEAEAAAVRNTRKRKRNR